MEEFLKKDAYYIVRAYVLIRSACDVSDKYSELLMELEYLTNKYNIGYIEILDAAEEMELDELIECADKLFLHWKLLIR